MKKRHAMKWVNALRSGKYKQGEGAYLTSSTGYCCLGVLDEIFPELDLKGDNKNILPNYFRIGLRDSAGDLGCGVSLSDLNDGPTCRVSLDSDPDPLRFKRFTFDEIADIIQIEYVEGLYVP